MTPNLFEIQNLSCSYTGSIDDRVLYIRELVIPRGQLIFLIGASGSGKSTLLETLGLMNNTIADGSVLFKPIGSETTERLENLWYAENISRLSAVRKRYFSFIFQNTNLMENFTAYENICMASMIQQDALQMDVMTSAGKRMTEVNLPLTTVGYETLAHNLSGGQRQRIAFVRALISKFTVLFGDEPTGNLDEANANELLEILRNALSPEQSIVVVSHDINLALAHSSMIICIGKNADTGENTITGRDVFRRHDWENKSPDELIQFRNHLHEYYHQVSKPNASAIARPSTSNKEALSRNFRKLFYKKEGKALNGKKSMNFLLLTFLFFFTLLAIGFANGSLDYLEKKMNNAFVNWLTISVPRGINDVDPLLRQLNSPEVKQNFNIRSVTGFSERSVQFWNNTKSRFQRVRGRSFDPGRDLLLRHVFSATNVLTGDSSFNTVSDFGLIVSDRFLGDFGYEPDANYIILGKEVFDSTTNNMITLRVPVPIRSVVREFPGKVSVAFTTYFRDALGQGTGSAFDIRSKSSLDFMIADDKKMADSCYRATKKFIDQHTVFGAWDPKIGNPDEHEDSYAGGFDMSISFYPQPESSALMDSLWSQLLSSKELQPFRDKIYRTYALNSFDEEQSGSDNYSSLSVNFGSLDKVREFNTYLINECNEDDPKALIEADLGKIQEKENFNFLSNVAYVISSLVILFGVVSICLFVINLLKMHLNKVKMNIGTFMAFGLSNRQSRGVYYFIIMRFVILAFAIAFACALVGGWLLDLLYTKKAVVEQGVSYFNLLHSHTVLATVAILVCVAVVSWRTISRMLNKTPGDLIYNR